MQSISDQYHWGEIFQNVFPQGQHTEVVVPRGWRLCLKLELVAMCKSALHGTGFIGMKATWLNGSWKETRAGHLVAELGSLQNGQRREWWRWSLSYTGDTKIGATLGHLSRPVTLWVETALDQEIMCAVDGRTEEVGLPKPRWVSDARDWAIRSCFILLNFGFASVWLFYNLVLPLLDKKVFNFLILF